MGELLAHQVRRSSLLAYPGAFKAIVFQTETVEVQRQREDIDAPPLGPTQRVVRILGRVILLNGSRVLA